MKSHVQLTGLLAVALALSACGDESANTSNSSGFAASNHDNATGSHDSGSSDGGYTSGSDTTGNDDSGSDSSGSGNTGSTDSESGSGSGSGSGTTTGSTDTNPVVSPSGTLIPDGARLLASQCFQCHGTDGRSSGGIESLAGESERELAGETLK
ncbi:MAG: hypothetical protein R3E89_10495 [Thiolinea sp.]